MVLSNLEADAIKTVANGTCRACNEFADNRLTGSFYAACFECKARSIAQSPLYFEASQAEAITPAYRNALQRAFGGWWREYRARVRHYAELIKKENEK